jgi:hypothetical protein
MDLQAEILKEHSARNSQRLVRYVGSHPGRVQQLVDFTCGQPGRLSQLAADILGWVAEAHPAALQPQLPRLLPMLEPNPFHPAVDLQAEVFDGCLALLGSGPEPVANKAYALTVVAALARQHPALVPEVLEVVEKQLPYAKPALQGRAARELPALRRLLLTLT